MKGMIKEKPVHYLFKVPDSAIIKNQAIEIGILKSEIEELKYKIEVHSIRKRKMNVIKTIYPNDYISNYEIWLIYINACNLRK